MFSFPNDEENLFLCNPEDEMNKDGFVLQTKRKRDAFVCILVKVTSFVFFGCSSTLE